MKEKIYKYLHDKAGSATTQEIVEQFFRVYGNYPPQMETIVESMLQDDPRFVRDETGEWQVQKKDTVLKLSELIFSILEIESITIDQRREIPLALGIVQVKNDSIILHQIYLLDLSAGFSDQAKNKFNQVTENFAAAPAFADHVAEIYQRLDQTIIVSSAPAKVMAIINYYFRNRMGSDLEAETISLVSLARQVIPDIRIRSIEDIANSLSISYHFPLDLKDRLNLTVDILSSFLQELRKSNIFTLIDLRAFIESAKTWVDFSSYNFNQDFIKNLPTKPGIYLMKDGQGKIFYVGKAKNLRSRVESYFVNRFEMDEKGKSILDRIVDLTYEQVGSELEALLLENRYINEFQPDLNVQVKIHSLDVSKYQHRQIVVFLPGKTEVEIVLFFVDGIGNLKRVVINRLKPNWPELTREVKHFFFDPSKKESNFSADQIEIFWRWVAVQQEKINFIDMVSCGALEKCLELLKRYWSDEGLLIDKIYYQ